MENGQVLAAEKSGFFTLGDVTFATAGEKTFRFEFQGGSNKVINTDRFIMTPVSEVLGQTPRMAITGEASLDVNQAVTLRSHYRFARFLCVRQLCQMVRRESKCNQWQQ